MRDESNIFYIHEFYIENFKPVMFYQYGVIISIYHERRIFGGMITHKYTKQFLVFLHSKNDPTGPPVSMYRLTRILNKTSQKLFNEQYIAAMASIIRKVIKH